MLIHDHFSILLEHPQDLGALSNIARLWIDLDMDCTAYCVRPCRDSFGCCHKELTEGLIALGHYFKESGLGKVRKVRNDRNDRQRVLG